MKYEKQFLIPIAGFESGTRQFSYGIDGKFFEQYPESEINTCAVELELEMIKTDAGYVMKFVFSGTVSLVCDRCLDNFDFDIGGEDVLTLETKTMDHQENTDRETVSPDAKEIDTRQYIYDFIMLRIPIRRVHPEDEEGNSLCDQEVLKKLEELSQKTNTDSPWDRLKDLQNN